MSGPAPALISLDRFHADLLLFPPKARLRAGRLEVGETEPGKGSPDYDKEEHRTEGGGSPECRTLCQGQPDGPKGGSQDACEGARPPQPG